MQQISNVFIKSSAPGPLACLSLCRGASNMLGPVPNAHNGFKSFFCSVNFCTNCFCVPLSQICLIASAAIAITRKCELESTRLTTHRISCSTGPHVHVEVFNLPKWAKLGKTGFSNLLESLELGPGSWELFQMILYPPPGL